MITRTKLIQRIVESRGTHWLIEAGAGFGKTVLIEQVRSASLDPVVIVRGPLEATDLAAFHRATGDAAHRVGKPVLAESMTAAETPRASIAALVEQTCSLAVDDLHLWDVEVAKYVLAMAGETDYLSPTVSVYGLTRRLPEVTPPADMRPHWSVIGASDLNFTVDDVIEELAALGIDDRTLASVLHERTGGWPVAVNSAAVRMQRGADPATLLRQLGQHNTIVEALLHDSVDRLEPADLQAASSLATLPFFDEKIAALVGSKGLLSRLVGVGLPITRQTDGWSTIAEVFQATLVQAKTPEFHQSVVEYLVERGEIQAAINVCISMGRNSEAARIVAGLDYEQEARLDSAMLNAAMTSIGDAALEHPRSLLVQSQSNATFGQLEMAANMIERAATIMASSDPDLEDPVHIELLLELGLWRIYGAQKDAALEILERCEAAIGPDDHGANRARLLDLRGMVSQAEDSEDGLNRARSELTEALQIWRRLQEPRAAAVTAFRLSASVLFRLGRRQEALDLLDSLPGVGRMTLVNKARLGLERAVVLPYVGRASEVPEALGETRELAGLLGHEWIIMWASWLEIVAASFEGDGERVQRLVDEYVANKWSLQNEVVDSGMWSEATLALARCGRHEAAADCLRRAGDVTNRMHFVDYAEAYLSAWVDPPEDALAKVRKLTEGTVEVEKQWSLPLLEALCQLRMGYPAVAADLLAQAKAAAAELGQPSLPEVAEGALVRRIVEAAANESPPAGESQTEEAVHVLDSQVRISIMDTFGVVVNGQPAAVPGGMTTTLLKLLAVNDGRMVVDQAIDPMWPDADLAVGRRRLRNVLRRVRQSCGDIIERSGESIRLAEGVDVDLTQAIAAATAVLQGAETTIDAVTAAIRLNDRPLLSDDRYEDWAEEARTDQHQRLVRLYDLQADLAERAGQIDLAVQALEAGQMRSAFDFERARRAYDLLCSVERSTAAAALAERHDLV